MKLVIHILELKLGELMESRKLNRKIKKRKIKKDSLGIYFRNKAIEWDKKDKERILSIRKAIKILKNHDLHPVK